MVKYGVIKASPKKFTLQILKNDYVAKLTILNNKKEYEVAINLGTKVKGIYFTIITSTDRAAIFYLLPMLEARFRLEWKDDDFNILRNNNSSGALDFMRNIILYEHIYQNNNLTYSKPNEFVTRNISVDVLKTDNTTFTNLYGSCATTIRSMFNTFKNRKIIIFGNIHNNKIFETGFNQNINKLGILQNEYNDGLIIFWDQLNNLVDALFIMNDKQYNDFIITLPRYSYIR